MQSSIWKILSLILLFAFGTSGGAAVNDKRGFTLVIDAGHGGHDPGASGKFSKEKNINLKVALAFGKLVEANCPDVRIVYTRRKDVFVPLQRRADIANKNKADLFISIHTNALLGGKLAYGSETYTLGMARASANLEVAKRENSVIKLESNYQHTYEGFDPNKAESYIIFEFLQDRYMKQSVDLAKAIQRQYKAAGRANKGVHQAGFLVLRNTSMPAVLTELGFITTPAEEKYLNSERGVKELSRSIYNGFLNYRRTYNKHTGALPKDLPLNSPEQPLMAAAQPSQAPRQTAKVAVQNAQPATQPLKPNGQNAQAAELPAQTKELAVVPVEAKPTPRYTAPNPYNLEARNLLNAPTDSNVLMASSTGDTQVAPKSLPVFKAENRLTAQSLPTTKNERDGAKSSTPSASTTQTASAEQKAATPQQQTARIKKQTLAQSTPTAKQADKKAKTQSKSNANKLCYHIQLGAGKQKISTTDPQFKGYTPERVREGIFYKYQYGNFQTYAEARKQLTKVRKSLPKAYIVAYVDGKLISLYQAQLTEKKYK